MQQRERFAGLRYKRWPRNERGQSLVFITITSAIVILALLFTYNVGQLSFYRIKLQNTADAAAYSAAVVQSRDLNFTAYMNRGVIANQVAVAQLVSLTGWARNFNDTYHSPGASIAQGLANLSPLGAMWTGPSKGLKAASGAIKSAVEPVATKLVPILDKLILGLNKAAQAYHITTLISIPLEVIPDVINANEDSKASLTTLGVAAVAYSVVQNYSFTKQFIPYQQKDGGDGKNGNRMANVTEASTDFFYRNRTLPSPVWPIPILIDPTRFFTYGFGPLLMMQFHSGGTVIKTAGVTSDNLQGYSSLDATGLLAIMMVVIPIFGIPVPVAAFPLPIPTGGGAAVAGTSKWASSTGLMPSDYLRHRNDRNDDYDGAAAVPFGLAHGNPMTAIPAWIKTGQGPGANIDTSAGIKPYFDLAKNVNDTGSAPNQAVGTFGGANQNILAPAWVLEIERDPNSYHTSSTYNIGGSTDGKLSLKDNMKDGKLKALSKAESYFSRPRFRFLRASATGSQPLLFPREGDTKTEWGSLYSPYWQPRLVANSIAEQVGAIAVTSLF
ncbi:MAG: pilus assembly protein TadG-related protein [Methylophilaceae bacterium]